MTPILILKTAALGDVLRTTSILPGLHERHPGARVAWVTAPAAVDLVRTHPLVERVEALDPSDGPAAGRLAERLAQTRWERLISLDDEVALCALASRVPARRLSGAYLAEDGTRAYTDDVAPWFDMGLLSRFGKQRADELKVANRRSHPEIYAEMLGIPIGKPRLVPTEEARGFARAFAARHALERGRPVIGLNTGAGGRWVGKQLPVERTVAVAGAIAAGLGGRATFVVFGGAPEAQRNREIVAGLAAAGLAHADAGCDNALLDFAALVALCDLLISSDSLALHVAIAQDVRAVAFFAPTSAAEIELYGLGEKVASTSPDYCSYRKEADTSSLTVERIAGAALRQLAGRASPEASKGGRP